MTNIIRFGNESRKFEVLSLAVKICSLPGKNKKSWQCAIIPSVISTPPCTIAAKCIKQEKTEMPNIAKATQEAVIQESAWATVNSRK